jgi:hypothetical protein
LRKSELDYLVLLTWLLAKFDGLIEGLSYRHGRGTHCLNELVNLARFDQERWVSSMFVVGIGLGCVRSSESGSAEVVGSCCPRLRPSG